MTTMIIYTFENHISVNKRSQQIRYVRCYNINKSYKTKYIHYTVN